MASVMMQIGIVVRESPPVSQWGEMTYPPIAILDEPPAAQAWTALDPDTTAAGERRWFAGLLPLNFHRTETANYRDNLMSGAPKLWIMMRPASGAPPWELTAVTADPAEGEAFTEIAGDRVDMIDMPASIAAALAAFVEAHHVERTFFKRKRDRANPDALSSRRREPTGGEDDA